MDTFLTALSLVLIIEGLLPFIAPHAWRDVFRKIIEFSDGQIRFYGLVSIACGLLLMILFGL
jgi:uncharacterized protein